MSNITQFIASVTLATPANMATLTKCWSFQLIAINQNFWSVDMSELLLDSLDLDCRISEEEIAEIEAIEEMESE